MKTTILILMLTFAAFGQLESYSLKPERSQINFVRKFHISMALFDSYNAEQREFLKRIINNPTKGMETEARVLFDKEDFDDIFLKIGTRDISTYKAVTGLQVLADKKRWFVGLPDAQKGQLWRTHFAYVYATKGLSGDQLDFLLKVGDALDAFDKPSIKKLGFESVKLFTPELGRELFATIGSYVYQGSLCKSKLPNKTFTFATKKTMFLPECPCSLGGSSWVCKDTCHSVAGSCAYQDAGCGFAWLWACDGTCSTNEEGN